MERLRVEGRSTKGYRYFRADIPKKVSNKYSLETGDILVVNIKKVIRKQTSKEKRSGGT